MVFVTEEFDTEGNSAKYEYKCNNSIDKVIYIGKCVTYRLWYQTCEGCCVVLILFQLFVYCIRTVIGRGKEYPTMY